jgi:hypothetical protein
MGFFLVRTDGAFTTRAYARLGGDRSSAMAAASVDCPTAMETGTRSTTVEATGGSSTVESATYRAVSDVATLPAVTTVPAVAAAKSRASPVTGASIIATAEPRSSADEDATGEVARTVISVRCAGVGVIPIVAVGTDRSWADVAGADAHTDCDALSISVRRQSQPGPKHCKDHQVFH